MMEERIERRNEWMQEGRKGKGREWGRKMNIKLCVRFSAYIRSSRNIIFKFVFSQPNVEELMLLNCGVGEDSWESLGLQPVHSEGDQPWDFFGRNDAKAETPVLWPPHAKSWLIGKDSYAGRDWGQEEKGTTEDEMVGWHHQLNGHGFEQTLGDGEGQGSVVCYSPWSSRVGHDWATEQQ